MQKYDLLNFDGEFDYFAGLMLQNSVIGNIKDLDGEDCLILLSHKPVITLGHFAKEENILMPKEFLKDKDISVYKTDRGGDVTYHGPGQLGGYPIIDIHRKRLVDYRQRLCRTLIDTLKDYNIEAEERYGKETGIWISDKKIASIGYAFKKFPEAEGKIITKHGFALYVLDDMENFRYINPCGMPGMKLTSIEEQIGKKVDFQELKEKYIKHFEEVFEYEPYAKA
ncbi:MAG: lipoyl(octanoyl) transferase LipB [Nanoarchaeota archaeon]|nr:lipoyl(octanoyl) transferase LipB [Nanoarchaeota archaeon]